MGNVGTIPLIGAAPELPRFEVTRNGSALGRKCARALRDCPQRAVGFGGADQVDPDPTREGWRDEEDEHLPSDEDFEDEEHE